MSVEELKKVIEKLPNKMEVVVRTEELITQECTSYSVLEHNTIWDTSTGKKVLVLYF